MSKIQKSHAAEVTPASQIKRELCRLAEPEVLAAKLTVMDKKNPLARIYIMGCGRSGTWLLTALLSTFAKVRLIAEELPIEYFGVLKTASENTLVLKREFCAYENIEQIPPKIQIIYIIRHPYDVLTSCNPAEPDKTGAYYISPSRWLGEMLALQYLVDTKRPNTLVLRYEDLVAEPEKTQRQLADVCGLSINTSVADIESVFKAPPEAVLAMHGLRKIDQNSVQAYKTSSEKIAYLQAIKPRLGRLLTWVEEQYGYDIDL